jgi:hypothetical protein
VKGIMQHEAVAMTTGMSNAMEDLESRYRSASGLLDRSQYKIFYGPLHSAEILVLGINPAGDPSNMLPDGVHHRDGAGIGAASASYYENDENDLLDCTWRENNILKLLVPLVGGDRESVRARVVKTNVAFRRSSKVTNIDIEHAKAEAVPFLLEIVEMVKPSLVLLAGVPLEDFGAPYCEAWTPIGDPVIDKRIKQTVFAAARMTLQGNRTVLGVQVAHASQFSWTYDQYGVVDRIKAL